MLSEFIKYLSVSQLQVELIDLYKFLLREGNYQKELLLSESGSHSLLEELDLINDAFIKRNPNQFLMMEVEYLYNAFKSIEEDAYEDYQNQLYFQEWKNEYDENQESEDLYIPDQCLIDLDELDRINNERWEVELEYIFI